MEIHPEKICERCEQTKTMTYGWANEVMMLEPRMERLICPSCVLAILPNWGYDSINEYIDNLPSTYSASIKGEVRKVLEEEQRRAG